MSYRTILDEMTQRAEFAETRLREIEHERIVQEVNDRTARQEAMQSIRTRELQEARTAEIEAARQASWLRWHTAPERINVFAMNQFDPVWLQNHTPPSGVWPADDALENHQYITAPLLAAEEFQSDSEPALVKEARARGIPI